MEQRNLIMAVVASITILLGWQFLYEQPRLDKELAARKAIENQKNNSNPPIIQKQLTQQTSKDATVPTPNSQTNSPAVPGSGALLPTAPIVGVPIKPKGPSRSTILKRTQRVQINSKRLIGSIKLKCRHSARTCSKASQT